jgi:hypothetical protein
MKKLSKNQILFAVISLVLTALFLHSLNYFIANQQWKNIQIFAVAFGVFMFLNGLINGYFDSKDMQKMELSFSYHLITFISFNAVQFLYLMLYSSRFSFMNTALTTLFWGVGVFVHYLSTKNTIKGYSAEELFD